MSLKVAQTLWRGKADHNAAWQLSNGVIRLVVTKLGGHIASISDDADGALNPLWQPKWESADPSKVPFDGAASKAPGWEVAERFGGSSESAVLAGIVGHNLCLPRFGGPRTVDGQQENQPLHGEAGVLPWTLADQGEEHVRFQVVLPSAGLSVSRTFSLAGTKATLHTAVVPTDGKAKEIEWAEHVTVGDPFMDGATVDADVDGAWMFSEPCPATRFPGAPLCGAVPPDDALAVPTTADPPCGDVVTTRVRRGRFAVANLGKTLTYSWDKGVFPWLCLWTENLSRSELPWANAERTRGLEFSTKAFPEPLNEARAKEFQGTPTTCAVPATGLETTLEIEWA